MLSIRLAAQDSPPLIKTRWKTLGIHCRQFGLPIDFLELLLMTLSSL